MCGQKGGDLVLLIKRKCKLWPSRVCWGHVTGKLKPIWKIQSLLADSPPFEWPSSVGLYLISSVEGPRSCATCRDLAGLSVGGCQPGPTTELWLTVGSKNWPPSSVNHVVGFWPSSRASTTYSSYTLRWMELLTRSSNHLFLVKGWTFLGEVGKETLIMRGCSGFGFGWGRPYKDYGISMVFSL